MNDGRFVYVTFIRTTVEKLWEALTQPEFTRQYWCECVEQSKWTKGSEWKLVAPDGRIADAGEVLEIDPPKKLVVSWQNHLFEELNKEGFSKATFTLEHAGNEVKLTVLHEMEKPNSRFIDSVSNGWPAILSSLKTLLETGKALDVSAKWPKGV